MTVEIINIVNAIIPFLIILVLMLMMIMIGLNIVTHIKLLNRIKVESQRMNKLYLEYNKKMEKLDEN